MKIKFEFEHCFGIEKLNEEIEFKAGQPAVVIYAPNGMMKTSFANTCAEIAKTANANPKRGKAAAAEKDPICDRLHPDIPSVHNILVDGTTIAESGGQELLYTLSTQYIPSKIITYV